MGKKYLDYDKKYLDQLMELYLSGEDMHWSNLIEKYGNLIKNIEARFGLPKGLDLIKTMLESQGKKLEARLLDSEFLRYKNKKLKINPEDIVFFLSKESFRPEYRLLKHLGKNGTKCLKDKVNDSIKLLEFILNKYEIIPVESIQKKHEFPKEYENVILKELQVLKEFENKTAIPHVVIDYKILAQKIKYISELENGFKEFNEKFSKKRINEMIDNYLLLDKVLKSKSEASYLLFRNYKGLITKLIYKKNQFDFLTQRSKTVGTLMDIARDNFLRAVNDYNPEKGSLSTIVHIYISQRVNDFYRQTKKQTSLHTPIQDCELIDLISSNAKFADYALEKKEFNDFIYEALEKLNERQKDVVCKFFGLKDMQQATLHTIGESQGCSHQNMGIIKQIAFDRLKFYLKDLADAYNLLD